MISRDRAAQAVIGGPATHEAAPSKCGLPPELHAELRRLLAAILVADVRAYPTVPQQIDEPAAELPNRMRRPK